jgi:hypothetical protein
MRCPRTVLNATSRKVPGPDVTEGARTRRHGRCPDPTSRKVPGPDVTEGAGPRTPGATRRGTEDAPNANVAEGATEYEKPYGTEHSHRHLDDNGLVTEPPQSHRPAKG